MKPPSDLNLIYIKVIEHDEGYHTEDDDFQIHCVSFE